jgi:aryl-alcohol dehydrogenase-like predicted oxidoreductase
MQKDKLGKSDLEVSAIGLGCMGIPDICQYKTRSPQSAKRALTAPFLDSSKSYFGSGSAPKFAWTKLHLSPFFT